MEGVLNKHRGALFNAFSKQFVELKNDLKKEEDERRKKEEAEKQKLEERIIELEGLVCGKCTPLSIPITERPTKNIETVDHGTEAREDEPSFSLREFEDKIATLNDTILSLQTELGKVRAENEALREGSRKAPTVDAETTTDGPEEPSKPMTSNAEAQTNDPEAPPPADSEDWKSKASTYRERLVTLLTAHKKLQEKHDEAKSKWTQWISRDEQQRDLITKFQNELRRLRESRGLSVEEHGLLAPLPGSSGPPPITPSKPPQPRDPLGSSPPPAMAALTPARVKPEPTSPSLLNHPLEIADSDADSDLTDSPPSPAPPPLTRNPRLPTANDAKIITIKSEPSTQSIFRGNTGIQDYSELDLDDIGAKAPTPRVVRSVDPDEARARAEALAEELSLGVDVEEEMVEALEDVESGGEELHRRLFSPTRPARPATESQMEEEDIRMELLGRILRRLGLCTLACLRRPCRLRQSKHQPGQFNEDSSKNQHFLHPLQYDHQQDPRETHYKTRPSHQRTPPSSMP
ncbi:hypothetical protein BJ508DRAFT_367777 [Ascobolus immersus RN42]|uniref:Uncharacterized protein n=1 Tax=Ascobolus immersus RN42 TaxID=1160509 RepID=A0A3N4HP21_ASCIM|nr:hypothetical protein BJ508DRAFT_367777 [Ascobolus immersus RN42]